MSIKFNYLECDKQLVWDPVPKERKIFAEQYEDQIRLIWFDDIIKTEISKDINQWQKFSDQHKKLLKKILLFFALADSYANVLSAEQLSAKFDSIWIKAMYSVHATFETIHEKTYSLLLDIPFHNDIDGLKNVQNEVMQNPAIIKMINCAKRYIISNTSIGENNTDENDNLGELLIGCIIFEGIMFIGWFAVIWVYMNAGYFPALGMANEYIRRDEDKHVKNHTYIYNNALTNKLPQSIVHKLFEEAVEIAHEFIDSAMDKDIIDTEKKIFIKISDLKEHIKAKANDYLENLHYDKLYPRAQTKFDMVTQLSLQFTSVHESKNTNYQQPISDPSINIWNHNI